MNSVEDKNASYLEQSVRQILEALIYNIIIQKPENQVKFMIDWLKNYLGTGNSTSNNSEIQELTNLRKEMKKYMKKYPGLCSEEEIHSDHENNSVGSKDKKTEEIKSTNLKCASRLGISAEAYGIYCKKEEYVPKVIPKTDEQKERIKNKMLENFMFNELDEKELMTVIDSFEEQKVEAKNTIIKENERGDILYLVDSGELDCFKKINGTDTYLKTYVSGESFGELALLYNAPRAATIIAKTDTCLWALERGCFNAIIKTSAMNRREQYEKVLRGVEILQTISQYEIGQICDAMKLERIKTGTKIITQNEEGNTFFILEEGEAYATKLIKDKEETVLNYTSGSYFGELALLKNEPRAANVYAKTDCKLLALDRMSFKRLLGPLEMLLKRNSEAYVKYINEN